MHKGTKRGLLEHLTKNVRPRNFKEGDLVLKVLKNETFGPREKMKAKMVWSFYYQEDHVRGCY